MANIQNIQVNSTNYPIAGYNFDGEWVVANVNLKGSISTISTSTVKTFDLSSILPNDSYDYMISVIFSGTTTSTSGNYFCAYIASGTQTTVHTSDTNDNLWVRICETRTRTSSTRSAGGTVAIPLKNNARTFSISIGGNTCTVGTIWLSGYKRIGKND